MPEEFDDIFDEIKKLFNLNSNLFDLEFFIFPESDFTKDLYKDKFSQKGIKISYHFEKGMDQPDMKIEGDIDEKKLQEYLKSYNIELDPRIRDFMEFKEFSKREIDANELTLELCDHNDPSCDREPYTELSDHEDFTEIVLDVPGIDKEDIIISFTEGNKKLTFTAQNKNKNYLKHIYLPFNSTINNYTLEVNNGMATIRVKRWD